MIEIGNLEVEEVVVVIENLVDKVDQDEEDQALVVEENLEKEEAEINKEKVEEEKVVKSNWG